MYRLSQLFVFPQTQTFRKLALGIQNFLADIAVKLCGYCSHHDDLRAQGLPKYLADNYSNADSNTKCRNVIYLHRRFADIINLENYLYTDDETENRRQRDNTLKVLSPDGEKWVHPAASLEVFTSKLKMRLPMSMQNSDKTRRAMDGGRLKKNLKNISGI